MSLVPYLLLLTHYIWNITPASSFKLTSHTIFTNAHLDSVTKQAAWNSVLDYILFNVILWAAHWGTNTHTHEQIKGFTWSGWWRVNRPEEMEEAHRGEWWEEMMRMMSAEWLASGTDPVRLSAKGVEDTERERWLQRGQEGETERAQNSRSKMMISVKILLLCDNQPRFPLSRSRAQWLCSISVARLQQTAGRLLTRRFRT